VSHGPSDSLRITCGVLARLPRDGSRTNSLLVNPIVSYRFGDGWSVSTSPNITANWASTSDKRWTVPIGAGIGKAFKIGTQPMTLKFETYYNVVRPGDQGSVLGCPTDIFVLVRTVAVGY